MIFLPTLKRVFYCFTDGGTKDARDWLQIQKEARIRRGEEDTSVFTKKKRIGQFEDHTKVCSSQYSIPTYLNNPANAREKNCSQNPDI